MARDVAPDAEPVAFGGRRSVRRRERVPGGVTGCRRSTICRRSRAARSGFFGYDLVRTVEPLGEPNPDPIGLPDMALMVSDVLVVFDHMRHELTLMAYAFLDDESELEAAYAPPSRPIADARERLGARFRARPRAASLEARPSSRRT